LNRREFLENSTCFPAALVLGFHWPAPARALSSPVADEVKAFVPNAWLTITTDNEITILAEKPELGQGSWTYTAMMVAEELEADWGSIVVEQAPTIPSVYQGLHTAGSGGVRASFLQMRQVGAQAREMLRTAGAASWGVPKADCYAKEGAIIHAPSGRRLSYGQLVPAAARLTPPDPGEVNLKPVSQFRCIGRSVLRVDLGMKVTGKACFGIDVRVPSMLYAVIARCPFFGGRLANFTTAAAKSIAGVRAIFPIEPLPRHLNTAGGVAVVAESTWVAIQARNALGIQWMKGSGGNESTAAALRSKAATQALGPPSYVAVDRSDLAISMSKAVTTLEATYESPFQAHATMEPMNTTVHVREEEIAIWSPTQFADEIQQEIAELSGLPKDRITVHAMLCGGSFGRRYQWDYAAEAWQVAKEMQQPVQLLWTREDDMQHDFYRPYNYQRLTAGLDASGRPVAWHTRVVTTPIAGSNLYTGFTESSETLQDPATVAALEWYGADVAPYAIPNCRVDYAPIQSVVPRSWWRSVTASYTYFAKECFIDELACAAGHDPRCGIASTSCQNTIPMRSD